MNSGQTAQIIKRLGKVVAFDAGKITTAIYKASAAIGRHQADLAQQLTQQVVQCLEQAGGTPSVEEVQDIVERVLIENNESAIAKAYIIYREDRARLRRQETESKRAALLPYKTMWQTLAWNIDHDCHTTAGLNRHLQQGTFADLVSQAEAASDERSRATSDAILETGTRCKMIVVAGPSSSGKTSTTAKIALRLQSAGVEVVPLAADHYFYDLCLHPQDEHGDYDFETPEALDSKLLNRHLEELLAGKPVELPIYDFKEGRRLQETRPLQLAKNQILLLDSLHGLYEPLTQSIPAELKFRIYIEPILQLRDTLGRWVRWTDLRLLRRMLRDATHRGYDPLQTLQHWHYVRRSELKHIIPRQDQADVILNGALPYELPIFKKHLEGYFPGFLETLRDNPSQTDAYTRAKRIANLFAELSGANDSMVPATSLLREFIGGSAFDLH